MIAGRRKWIVLLLVLVIAAAAWGPASDLAWAARMLLGLRDLAGGLATGEVPVVASVMESRVRREWNGRPLQALVYRGTSGATGQAVVLAAGVSELGCYHPRLMALSRMLAAEGLVVVTPDIEEFRHFKVDPEAMDQMAFWFEQARTLYGAGAHPRKVGLGGISFSGTLALIAAARPGIREAVSFVLAIGPYDDLLRTSKGWFAAGPRTVGEGHYPTRFYAKWIIMLAAIDRLPYEPDRRHLNRVLRDLLLQKQVGPPPDDLSPEAARWHRLAVAPEDQADPELAREIEDYLAPRLYGPLSPAEAAPQVRCPVFIVHGAHDDLIPPSESEKLRARITGAPTRLLVTPFLTHTHPQDAAFSWTRDGRAALDMLGFFYALARVVR